MDRHAPLHCFRKHCAGAGIHAQEIFEKFARHGVIDANHLLEQIKILKSIPCVLEEFVLKYDAGSISALEYASFITGTIDEIRKMRQEALSWIPAIRQVSSSDTLELWQKDYIQEINEYAGELWQMEKHMSEYLADFLVKEKQNMSEQEIKQIGRRLAEVIRPTSQ